jgi:hypothetical protein
MDKVYAYLREYAVTTLLKLSGWKAWVANIVFKKLWKELLVERLFPAVKRAWDTTLDKLRDNKALRKYADEMAKGKDSDEDQKLKDQLDIINPKP